MAVSDLAAEQETAVGPTFDPRKEVRLAIVMYGGVSLAIYMYGVAEELFHLVRATAPSTREPGRAAVAEAEGTEAVYRELAHLLAGGEPDAAAPIRTRFVVDIISGTSAGGINGICLAKALANDTSIAGLKEVWLSAGDIGGLVNDDLALVRPDGTVIEGLRYTPPPRSLLASARMALELDAALAKMTSTGEDRPDSARLVDELDLWVTATDLEGLRLPIRLADRTITEKRHRARFHFRLDIGQNDNDFGQEENTFLAFAARCTSSFPFAFDPMRLRDVDDFHPPLAGRSATESWRRFYREYPVGQLPEFVGRSFSDGGILDNKPFTHATQSLVSRRADLEVDRKLVYIEPSPESPTQAELESPRDLWNAIDTAQAALLGLPGTEAIREDIQAVLTRNRQIERARELLAGVGGDARERAKLEALASEEPDEDWAKRTLGQTIEARGWGPSYGTYHRLKVRALVDFLAGLVVRASKLDPASDDAFAAHYLVRAWKLAHFSEDGVAPPGVEGPVQTENAFLIAFDVPYRIRRLNFALQKLRELRSEDPQVVELVLTSCGLAPPLPAGGADVFTAFRSGLCVARGHFYDAIRELRSSETALGKDLQSLGITRDALRPILDGGSDERMLAAARKFVDDNPGAFAQLAKTLQQRLSTAAQDARTKLVETLGEHTSGRSPAEAQDLASTLSYALRFFYDSFEAYDLVGYPIEYGTELGETNPVEVVRISPLDARTLRDGPEAVPPDVRALKGLRLHHFGAFLDRRWRRHDMVWGRLDGAERLIRMLLPPRDPRAAALIRKAHTAIVREYAAESLGRQVAEVGEEEAWAWFRERSAPPEEADRAATRAALVRAGSVVGELLEAILAGRPKGPGVRGTIWAAVRKMLSPKTSTAGAAGRLLAAGASHKWFGLVYLTIALAIALASGMIVVGGDWMTAGLVIVGAVGFAALAIVVAVVAGTWSARRALFARVEKLVFERKQASGTTS